MYSSRVVPHPPSASGRSPRTTSPAAAIAVGPDCRGAPPIRRPGWLPAASAVPPLFPQTLLSLLLRPLPLLQRRRWCPSCPRRGCPWIPCRGDGGKTLTAAVAPAVAAFRAAVLLRRSNQDGRHRRLNGLPLLLGMPHVATLPPPLARRLMRGEVSPIHLQRTEVAVDFPAPRKKRWRSEAATTPAR